MPFLALCAGVGGEVLARKLWPNSAGLKLRWLTTLLAAFMLLPAAWAALVNYGHQGPVYFALLPVVHRGRRRMGLPRNFWGYSTVDVLPAINEKTADGPLVFWHKATSGAIRAYKRQNCFGKMFDIPGIGRQRTPIGQGYVTTSMKRCRKNSISGEHTVQNGPSKVIL